MPLPGHDPRRFLRRVEETLEVGADQGVDIRFVVLGKWLGNEDAGVVDQQVDPAKGLLGAGEQALRRARLGDVASHADEARWVAEASGGLLQAGLATGVADHVVAAFEEGLGQGETQAARGPGNDDGAWRVHVHDLQ
ncbi:hypothetical protein D3C75_856870 [compost metagenome]